MEAKVLNKNQVKKALSSRKVPQKSIRSVLKSSESNYRPIASEEEVIALNTLLEQLLPVCRRIKNAIPWSEIKNIPLTERNAFRKKYNNRDEDIKTTIQNRSLIRGINAVIRGLEKNTISVVLLSSDIKPALMMKPILSLCLSKQVPILILPLREITRNTLNHSCIALGIGHLPSGDYFWPLVEKIKEISSKKLPEPKRTNLDIKMEINSEPPVEVRERKCVYLYRSSCKERVFIPNSYSSIKTDSMDFISLTKSDKSDNVGNKTNVSDESEYKSLKIKKVRGNSQRKRKNKN